MRRLTVFNLMTLDGYIAGQGGDISWYNVGWESMSLRGKKNGRAGGNRPAAREGRNAEERKTVPVDVR